VRAHNYEHRDILGKQKTERSKKRYSRREEKICIVANTTLETSHGASKERAVAAAAARMLFCHHACLSPAHRGRMVAVVIQQLLAHLQPSNCIIEGAFQLDVRHFLILLLLRSLWVLSSGVDTII